LAYRFSFGILLKRSFFKKMKFEHLDINERNYLTNEVDQNINVDILVHSERL